MFWFKICGVLFVSGIVALPGYYDFEELDDSDDDCLDYYEKYNAGQTPGPNSKYEDFAIRVKRFQNQSSFNTLSPEEIRGALKQMFSNMDFKTPITPQTQDDDPDENDTLYNSEILTAKHNTDITYLTNIFTQLYDNSLKNRPPTRSSLYTNISRTPLLNSMNDKFTFVNLIQNKDTTNSVTATVATEPLVTGPVVTAPITTEPVVTALVTTKSVVTAPVTTKSVTATRTATKTVAAARIASAAVYAAPVTNASVTISNTTTSTTTTSPQLDIPRLLEIIVELASEFETNLTRKLNETLKDMSIPTCTTPSTEPPVTSEYDANYTGATIAKCFVCGLDIPGIPFHAECADAFEGDFLPLVPVDPTAKGKISTYRKYCKYSNIARYYYDPKYPRAIYGRWTGGCAVRWIDLSGIYTQRTCRNRLFPTVGKHFASKRMAKLERSLWSLENGCITSPMATLVPLSRGISLYARFHACVCTGNWCNNALMNQWSLTLLLSLYICNFLQHCVHFDAVL